MRPLRQVTQTIFAGDPSGRYGNCFQAAIASILELDLEQVPHFAEARDWVSYVNAWAALNGWSVRRYFRTDLEGVDLAVADGPGPRGYHHAVAVKDGQIAWDPHPSRAGLLAIETVWAFTPADPADTRHQMHLESAHETIAAILAEPPLRRSSPPLSGAAL